MQNTIDAMPLLVSGTQEKLEEVEETVNDVQETVNGMNEAVDKVKDSVVEMEGGMEDVPTETDVRNIMNE